MGQPVLKIIRDADFAKRLESACDRHPHIPPLYKGRLTWVREQLRERFQVVTSTETVRKWFAGEVKPRPNKIAMLAEMLEVDVSWLQLGIDQNLAPRQKKARSALAGGAVNVVAGLIQMDGGNVAFPADGDKRAAEAAVDLYAIIKGASYAFHVAFGEPVERDGVQFAVPVDRDGTIVLGLVRDGMNIMVMELTDDVIERHGGKRGAAVEVRLNRAVLGKMPLILGFKDRL